MTDEKIEIDFGYDMVQAEHHTELRGIDTHDSIWRNPYLYLAVGQAMNLLVIIGINYGWWLR